VENTDLWKNIYEEYINRLVTLLFVPCIVDGHLLFVSWFYALWEEARIPGNAYEVFMGRQGDQRFTHFTLFLKGETS